MLTLRIIRIDPERRRLGLSLKKVDQAEYAEADWRQGLQEAMGDVPEVEAPPPGLQEAMDDVPEVEAPPPGETQPT